MIRMLTASICSILLCMGCLAGTTWAWYTVNLTSPENVIHIPEPKVEVRVNDSEQPFESGANLSPGANKITIFHGNDPDAFDMRATLYVTVTIGDMEPAYVLLDTSNFYKAAFTVNTEKDCKLSWTVSWYGTDELELLPEIVNVGEPAEPEETDPTETETTETEPAVTEPTVTEPEEVPDGSEPDETPDPSEDGNDPDEGETPPDEGGTPPDEGGADPDEGGTPPSEDPAPGDGEEGSGNEGPDNDDSETPVTPPTESDTVEPETPEPTTETTVDENTSEN